MGKIERGITIRKLRKMSGNSLTVGDFITEPGPCENKRLFMPMTEVPGYLMSKTQEARATKALDECISVVGAWGENRSKFETEGFQKPAEEFKRATGVSAEEVFKEVFSRLMFSSDG